MTLLHALADVVGTCIAAFHLDVFIPPLVRWLAAEVE
jgi:hypothetical protein